MSAKNRSFFLIWVGLGVTTLFVGVILAFTLMWTISDIVEPVLGEFLTILMAGCLFGFFIGGGFSLGQAIILAQSGQPPLRWALISAGAGAVGMAIGMVLANAFGLMDNTPDILTALMIGLASGLPIALVQYRMLCRRFEMAHIWIPICTAALLAGFLIGLPLGGEDSGYISIIVIVLLPPLITGAGMLTLMNGQEPAIQT